MANPPSPPKLRLHKASGRAVVTLLDALTGKRRDHYLGTFGTPEAHEAYAQLIRDWETRGRTLNALGPRQAKSHTRGRCSEPAAHSIAALCLAYVRHVEKRGGISPTQVACIKQALKILRQTCGSVPVARFGPLLLHEVRQSMLAVRFGAGGKKRWTRSLVNRRVRYIIRMFRWAVAHERAPIALPEALACVEPLKPGEYGVPEGRKIKPVPEAHIDAIKPYVSGVVWAMIQTQRYTAARAGEICVMRPIDLDTTGDVWLYRPSQHKNAKRGHDRTIYVGGRAQEAIGPCLVGRAVDAYVFDPRESLKQRAYANAVKGRPRRANQRKTIPKTGRQVRDHFDTTTYQRAITEACKKAGVPHWSSHQLRHLAATNARKAFGAEAALLVLGDRSTRLVDVYAEKDTEKARQVIAKIG
ncbi:MAG: tyrosine-type recombinase/integrase [Planctomycetota bacterium]